MNPLVTPKKSCIRKSSTRSRSDKRKATFSLEPAEVSYLQEIPPASQMTDGEKDAAWYSNDEMAYMKEKTRSYARRIRISAEHQGKSIAPNFRASGKCSSSPPLMNEASRKKLIETFRKLDDSKCTTTIETERVPFGYEIRGLEHRICLERPINKYFAEKAILECQRRTKTLIKFAASKGDPNLNLLKKAAAQRISEVSMKFTAWSRELAADIGISDYEEVYCKKSYESPLSSATEVTIGHKMQPSSPSLKRNFLQISHNSHVSITRGQKRQRSQKIVDLALSHPKAQIIEQNNLLSSSTSTPILSPIS